MTTRTKPTRQQGWGSTPYLQRLTLRNFPQQSLYALPATSGHPRPHRPGCLPPSSPYRYYNRAANRLSSYDESAPVSPLKRVKSSHSPMDSPQSLAVTTAANSISNRGEGGGSSKGDQRQDVGGERGGERGGGTNFSGSQGRNETKFCERSVRRRDVFFLPDIFFGASTHLKPVLLKRLDITEMAWGTL